MDNILRLKRFVTEKDLKKLARRNGDYRYCFSNIKNSKYFSFFESGARKVGVILFLTEFFFFLLIKFEMPIIPLISVKNKFRWIITF